MNYTQSIYLFILKIFHKRFLVLLLAIVVLGLAIYLGVKSMLPAGQSMPAKVVEAVTIVPSNIQQTARLLGTIRPKHATILITKTSGTLDFLVLAGESVKKGTIIAKIENADLEANYKLSESAEDIAKKQYDRTQTLFKAGHVSAKMLEDQKNTWIEAQKRLANTRIDLDKSRFLAPFDGIVGVFKSHEGSQLEVGDPVVSFYDPSQLMVEFDIPDSLITHLHDGQSVIINGNSYPLTHVQRMIDEETHMCPAYVDMTCQPTCLIGSSVPLDLVLKERRNTIVVPYESTFLREGKMYVYRVKDEKVHLTPVTLGIREKDKVEIIEGLTMGDVVVSVQPQRLYPEMVVKIHQSKLKRL